MVAIDFFCGAGGLTCGLKNAGIKVVLGIDVREEFRKTYESNNKPAKFLCADVRQLDPCEVLKLIPETPKNELLLAGCAPCQPFTKQRRENHRVEEHTLLTQFGRFVAEILPGQIVIENVPGIRKVEGFSTYRRFQKLLADLGYCVCEGIIDAKDYGVPQTRRRFVMIGARDFEPTLPPPTHGPGRQPYVTVRKAIAAYPVIKPGEQHPSVANHRAAALSPLNLHRLRHTPKNGGGRTDWPAELYLDCHKEEYSGHTDVYGRMWWDRPAPALTCRFPNLSTGRYGHPTQNRAISLREAARLQSFDDSFVFFGSSQADLATQIGNAVPVRIGEAIGRHLFVLRQTSSANKTTTAPCR
ncbi:MAG: DNA cytosine methyltransferase [Verrucomicrobiia bacterium]|jgi:DNA (cytosine-5)-methyltransferase 1